MQKSAPYFQRSSWTTENGVSSSTGSSNAILSIKISSDVENNNDRKCDYFR